MSLDTTDQRGRFDIPFQAGVRFFLFSGTQHVPAAVPAASICQQLSNPNRYQEGLRALLVALRDWVVDRAPPPHSQVPRLFNGTLVRSNQASIGWPNIPGVKYTGILNELTLLDFGRGFDAADESGVLAEPPRVVRGADYTVLVPKVDADGNEIAGLRSVTLQAALGTYTGWNLRRTGFAEDEECGLTGSFVPVARTKAERDATGDAWLSLEERYGTHDGYVEAVRATANHLVAERLLLAADAELDRAGAGEQRAEVRRGQAPRLAS